MIDKRLVTNFVLMSLLTIISGIYYNPIWYNNIWLDVLVAPIFSHFFKYFDKNHINVKLIEGELKQQNYLAHVQLCMLTNHILLRYIPIYTQKSNK